MARQIIFTHVGTSLLTVEGILERTGTLLKLLPALGTNFDPMDYLDQMNQQLGARLLQLAPRGRSAWLRHTPAEIASLTLLNPQPGDIIVLIHSETSEGRLCGEALAQQLRSLAVDHLKGAGLRVVSKGIEDLRLDDEAAQHANAETKAQTFVRKGLPNYIAAIHQHYRDREAGDRFVFNVTGGYKGMIPIARDLATILENHSNRQNDRPIRTELVYLFQGNAELIRFGTIPSTLDWDALHRLKAKFSLAAPKSSDGPRPVGGDPRAYTKEDLQLPYFTGNPPEKPDRILLTPTGQLIATVIELFGS